MLYDEINKKTTTNSASESQLLTPEPAINYNTNDDQFQNQPMIQIPSIEAVVETTSECTASP